MGQFHVEANGWAWETVGGTVVVDVTEQWVAAVFIPPGGQKSNSNHILCRNQKLADLAESTRVNRLPTAQFADLLAETQKQWNSTGDSRRLLAVLRAE